MGCFVTFIFNRISVNRRLWTWNEWKMQCHHGTGYCWCVTPDGKPIPGSSIRHTKPNCKRQSKFQLSFSFFPDASFIISSWLISKSINCLLLTSQANPVRAGVLRRARSRGKARAVSLERNFIIFFQIIPTVRVFPCQIDFCHFLHTQNIFSACFIGQFSTMCSSFTICI